MREFWGHNTYFDAMGNRKSWQKTSAGQSQLARYTPNNLNQIVSQSLTVNGERTTFGYTHDAGGNLTQRTNSDGSKTLYTYDDADRLIRIETRDPNNAPLHKSEFTYDGFSRKAISKEFDFTGGAWTLQSETRRVFDGLDCVQERNAQNEVVASYTRDGNIGGILSRTSATGKSYYHYDGGGNVTQLTDETGETVARYRYDAFGNTLEASGSRAAENLYRFSTKEFHAASGLYNYGYRFYSPGLGRWINRDPIQESGGLNLYGFVFNDPVNGVDAYGLAKVELRYWYLLEIPLGGGHATKFYHAYIIVSENDGSKPYIFHGWHEGNFNFKYDSETMCVGANGYLTGHSGPFTSGWPEYKNSSKHPSQVFVNKDNKPAKYYIDKFKIVNDAYNKDRVLYDYLGPNSNTLVWQILDRSLPQKMPAPIKSIPGFNHDGLWGKR